MSNWNKVELLRPMQLVYPYLVLLSGLHVISAPGQTFMDLSPSRRHRSRLGLSTVDARAGSYPERRLEAFSRDRG